jgi:antigen flippase
MEETVLEKKSYRQILMSTSIMGVSSLVIIGFRIIRTKALAVILGPSGVGLWGLFDSITNLVQTVTGMGIGSSGVRQIAEAAASNDQQRIAKTVICLRRTALFTGLAGLSLQALLSVPLSRFTFGNGEHAGDLALLSVTILLTSVAAGQMAVIQGTRRIKDLALLSMLSAFYGTVLSIPFIYVWGTHGIPPFLISVSVMHIFASWWYSRKLKILPVAVSWRETVAEAKPLLHLGLFFMTSSLMTAGTYYLLRVLIVRDLGLEGAGIYQAAASLAMIYTSFILEAMGRDFYPRLTAVGQDNALSASLMNKQMEVGLLLAAPGILATMTLAPLVITVFYSPKFTPAVVVLRWEILGVLLRVITWPMSYIFPARGNGKLFFWTEVFANATLLGLVWLGLKHFGLPGAGMAFFGMYILYSLLIYWIVTRSYDFVLAPRNRRVLAIVSTATVFAFAAPYLVPATAALVINSAVTIAIGIYSLRTILDVAGDDYAGSFLVRIKSIFQR